MKSAPGRTGIARRDGNPANPGNACSDRKEGKARSAVLFKKPTQALEEVINQGRYAAITARGFIEMQGGLPIVVDGEVIGGIGASFATPEEDEQVAKAGFAALSK
jgi:glc operon protein GlcG